MLCWCESLLSHSTQFYSFRLMWKLDYWYNCSSLNFIMLPLCLDHAALCQFLRGKHRLAIVGLHNVPVEVLMAILSTESSTMEGLQWNCVIHVRAFIHCTMYVCEIPLMCAWWEVGHVHPELHASSFACFWNTLQVMQCLFISPCRMMHQVIYLIPSGAHLWGTSP